jgi:LacI family transcriptional regulator
MKKSQVTAQKVAERAGVSQTTVSFVLNDIKSANISEATRNRVSRVARELGYVPRAAARSLAKGRSDNLGFVLLKPHQQVFYDSYVPNLTAGISRVAQKHGLRIMLEMVEDIGDFETIRTLLLSGEVAGIILSGPVWDIPEEISALVADGQNIVSLDQLSDPSVHSVRIDHPAGIQLAVAHLVNLQYRRIACIAYAPSNPHVEQRLAAYRSTLESAGIPYDEALVRYGNFDPESGYAAMQSLLKEKPAAIFGMNDMMAIGAMAAIREAGLRIPDDIAVVGYDDVRVSRFACPSLTTVRAPEVELGQRAGEMLIELINGVVPAVSHVKLQGDLIVRESCGANKR